MARYSADLSVIGDFNILERYVNVKNKEFGQDALRELDSFADPLTFVLPPTLKPWRFYQDIKNQSNSSDHHGRVDELTKFKKGTTTLSFIFSGGIIVAVDSRASMGTFISSSEVKKVIEINDYLLGTLAGGAADCAFWERHLSKLCRLHELRNGERISVAAASNLLSNIFFHYRGYGLCCGIMIAGWDSTGPQLYFVNDSGARIKNNIFSCGSGSSFAYGVLDSEYKYDMKVDEAIELGKRAIYQATHRDGGSGGHVNVYLITDKGRKKVVDMEDVNKLHDVYSSENGVPSDML